MARQSRTSEGRGAQSRRAEGRPQRKSRYQGRTYVNPDVIPKGMTYSWLAESVLNEPQPDNITMKMVNGWKPVPASRHPEMVAPPLPGYEGSEATIIRRGGLLLVEKPTRDVRDEQRELAEENRQIMEGISWAAPDEAGMVRQDYGSRVDIERVTARSADFKDD
jgi:hypothetical protein